VPAGARSTTAEAVAHADQRMYEDKRRRTGERRVERTGVEA
jgi:hypothetical protein